MTKTHWKTLINPDYIGAYWLPHGEDVTVTIDYVVREQVTGSGGKKEECTVAHMKGGVKPFILNVTNSKTIAKLYGNYIEDWAGKSITLYASTAKLAGEVVECLRVRPKVMQRQKPAITETRLIAALTKIASGDYTAEKLRENFALTDEQDQLVTDTLAGLAAGLTEDEPA